eukprot:420475-Rhodomonas_salina.1
MVCHMRQGGRGDAGKIAHFDFGMRPIFGANRFSSKQLCDTALLVQTDCDTVRHSLRHGATACYGTASSFSSKQLATRRGSSKQLATRRATACDTERQLATARLAAFRPSAAGSRVQGIAAGFSSSSVKALWQSPRPRRSRHSSSRVLVLVQDIAAESSSSQQSPRPALQQSPRPFVQGIAAESSSLSIVRHVLVLVRHVLIINR